MIFPVRLRHHGQGEQTEHILFPRLREFHAHGQWGNSFDRGAFVDQTKLGHTFGHKFVEGEGDIFCHDGRTIMKTGARVDRDFNPRIILRITCTLGNQRIIAAGLVIRSGEEGVVELFGSGGGITAQRIAVEIVKCAKGGKRDLTAFGGGGIGVIEMVKIERVFRLSQYREGITLFDRLRLDALAHQHDKQQQYANDYLQRDSFSCLPASAGHTYV